MNEAFQSMSKKKKERTDAIKIIISNHSIRSQEELVERLKEDFGIESNQSTVSRDITSLELVKHPQTNCYQLGEFAKREKEREELRSVLEQAEATYFDENVSMITFRADPVFTSLITAKLEAYFSNKEEVIGTLVGPTGTVVLLVTKDGEGSVRKEINNIFD